MRIIVGVSGATGVGMGYYLLKALRAVPDCEIHLVVTDAARKTWDLETVLDYEEFTSLADVVHDAHNMAASISSGSFFTDGMIVLPCSMKTLAGIISGYTDNLVLRAADVCLKEGRKVVLAPREMPLGKVHLQNMLKAADLGCVIIPPMLTFYNHSMTVQEQVDHIIGKILMQFGILPDNFRPWEGVD